MEVGEAVRRAKQYVADVFSVDGITDVALEEVRFDARESSWQITIGFNRGWEAPSLYGNLGGRPARRVYKLVRVSDESGEVLSVMHRDVSKTA